MNGNKEKSIKKINVRLTPVIDSKLRQIAQIKRRKMTQVIIDGIEMQWEENMENKE